MKNLMKEHGETGHFLVPELIGPHNINTDLILGDFGEGTPVSPMRLDAVSILTVQGGNQVSSGGSVNFDFFASSLPMLRLEYIHLTNITRSQTRIMTENDWQKIVTSVTASGTEENGKVTNTEANEPEPKKKFTPDGRLYVANLHTFSQVNATFQNTGKGVIFLKYTLGLSWKMENEPRKFGFVDPLIKVSTGGDNSGSPVIHFHI